MPWNPEIYNQFKTVRNQPFFDLMDLIVDDQLHQAIDIGCGTGEQTQLLSQKFENTHFLGIDSSAEMLSKSKEFESSTVQFAQKSIEEILNDNKKFDLVFSNAALQWSDHHESLFPQLFSIIKEYGQLAVQMPVQNENILNKLLMQLASEEPYKSWLNDWNRKSSVLEMDQYAQILFDFGFKNIQICKKIYPIIAEDAETLFQFISGSALIPYLERLNENQQQVFIHEFNDRIQQHFTQFPAIYAFKRLLIYGRKS